MSKDYNDNLLGNVFAVTTFMSKYDIKAHAIVRFQLALTQNKRIWYVILSFSIFGHYQLRVFKLFLRFINVIKTNGFWGNVLHMININTYLFMGSYMPMLMIELTSNQ